MHSISTSTIHTYLGEKDADTALMSSDHTSKDSKKDVTPVSLRPTPVKSRQLKALTYKTLSQQKRQWKSNLCCVYLCPVLVVIIAGTLANTFMAMFNTMNANSLEYLFCSNMNASNSTFGFPYMSSDQFPFTPSDDYPGAKDDTIYHTNYFSFGTLPLVNYDSKFPCEYEYGGSYATSESSLYHPTPELPENPLTKSNYSEMFLRDS